MRFCRVGFGLEGLAGVKDKDTSCEQRAESVGETSEISTAAALTGTSGSGGGGDAQQKAAEVGWRLCQSTIPLFPCRQVHMPPPPVLIAFPHTFPREIRRRGG